MNTNQHFQVHANNISSVELFVGDLSFFCVEEDLVPLFAPYGRVLDAVVCRSDTRGHSLLYGFVKMSDRESANKAATALNQMSFMGRTLRVQVGAASGATAVKTTRSGVHIHVTFTAMEPAVANNKEKERHYLVSEVKLREIFSRAGEILDVIVKRYAVLKNPPSQVGYGFVYFKTSEEAERAIADLHGEVVDGIALQCELTHNREGKEDAATDKERAKARAGRERQPSFCSSVSSGNNSARHRLSSLSSEMSFTSSASAPYSHIQSPVITPRQQSYPVVPTLSLNGLNVPCSSLSPRPAMSPFSSPHTPHVSHLPYAPHHMPPHPSYAPHAAAVNGTLPMQSYPPQYIQHHAVYHTPSATATPSPPQQYGPPSTMVPAMNVPMSPMQQSEAMLAPPQLHSPDQWVYIASSPRLMHDMYRAPPTHMYAQAQAEHHRQQLLSLHLAEQQQQPQYLAHSPPLYPYAPFSPRSQL